jgi:hypothetical protein
MFADSQLNIPPGMVCARMGSGGLKKLKMDSCNSENETGNGANNMVVGCLICGSK